MPKIVDHDNRREQLAEAAWRVIRREGIEGVSVRRVADEAGISLGSLRHYFVTQSELLAFSMRLVSDRVTHRVENLVYNGEPRQYVEQLIGELLPLDEERRAECEVWLAFIGRAIADSSIHALSLEVHDRLYEGIRRIIELCAVHDMLPQGVDIELEAKRLHALIDGLVVHGVTRSERLDAKEITRVIVYHLNHLLKK